MGREGVSVPGWMPMAFSLVYSSCFPFLSSDQSIELNKLGLFIKDKWANPLFQFQTEQTTTHSYPSEKAVSNELTCHSNQWGGLVCEKRALYLCCHGHLSYQTKTEHSLCLAQQVIITMTYEEMTSKRVTTQALFCSPDSPAGDCGVMGCHGEEYANYTDHFQ